MVVEVVGSELLLGTMEVEVEVVKGWIWSTG